jgi:hypothetical protein
MRLYFRHRGGKWSLALDIKNQVELDKLIKSWNYQEKLDAKLFISKTVEYKIGERTKKFTMDENTVRECREWILAELQMGIRKQKLELL